MGEFSSFALVPEQGAQPEMAQLDGEMQRRISALAARIDVRDSAAVLGFGARTQKEMTAFTDIALAQMLTRETGSLSGVIDELGSSIRSCSFAGEAKGFLRRMLGGAAPYAEVLRAYEKAEPRISACADEMTDRRTQLMRDSALLDRVYERNEELYRELCSLIVIGEEAVRQAKVRKEDLETVSRLERRIEDIRVTKLASTQLAAQICAVQQSNSVACEKLKLAVETTIPLWKSQMAAALGLARATDALAMHNRAQKEAARGIRSGSNELRAQGRALAKEAGEADRERAEQTAQALLLELEAIERELKKEQNARI